MPDFDRAARRARRSRRPSALGPRADGRGHRAPRARRSRPRARSLPKGATREARLRAARHDAPSARLRRATRRACPRASALGSRARLDELVREVPGRHARRRGSPSVRRDRGVHHDSRARRARATCSSRARGSATHGARFVADAARARRRRPSLVERGRDRRDARRGAHRGRRRAARALAFASAAVYGHPTFALDVVGITGTNGKTTTTHLVQACIDGCGRARRDRRDARLPLRGARPAADAHEPRGRRARADRGARCDARGATHLVMEVSSIALAARARRRGALPRRGVHEPHAGPPRLPRHDGGLRRGQGAALRRARAPAPRRSTSTIPSGASSRAASRRGPPVARARSRASRRSVGARATRPRSRPLGSCTRRAGIALVARTPAGDVEIALAARRRAQRRRTCSRALGDRAGCSSSTSTPRRAALSRADRRARPARALRRARPRRRRRARRLRAHARRARARARERAGARRRAGSSASSAAAAIAIRRSAR